MARRAPHFPADENGEVLRRMYAAGDELTEPRMIDFCFVFPARRDALEFARLVDDDDLEVCISAYKERRCWQVVVRKRMVPTHAGITATVSTLAGRAESVGGEPDGWGCLQNN